MLLSPTYVGKFVVSVCLSMCVCLFRLWPLNAVWAFALERVSIESLFDIVEDTDGIWDKFEY